MNSSELLRQAITAQRNGISRNTYITGIPQEARFAAFQQWDRATELCKLPPPTDEEIRTTQRFLAMTKRLLRYFSTRPPSPWAPKTKQSLIDEFVLGIEVKRPENMETDAKPVRAFMEDVTEEEIEAERQNAIISLIGERGFLRARLGFDDQPSELACSDKSSWRSVD